MTLSLHEKCMDAVVSTVAGLTLTEDLETRVYKQKLPDLTAAEAFPSVFVTLKGCKSELHPFSTREDEKILPVAIHLLDRQDVKDSSTLSPWLLWLGTLETALLSVTFPDAAVPGNWHIDLVPMDAWDAAESAGPGYQHAVSSFFARFACVVLRGTNP